MKMHSLPWQPEARGPLHGLRILDLSRVAAGNMLTLQLADFGAEVLKVEPPGGDTLRGMKVEGAETYWKVYARNKKSVCVDFRRPESIELLKRLAADADALIENFRPGTLEDMGLGPDVLLGINPGLVVVRISGWGHTGRYRHKPGFGTLAEGYSGFAAISGFADREPLLPAIFLGDMTTGLYGAYAVMVGLWNVRINGGTGQVIELSLFDAMLSILGPQAANFKLTGQVKPRTGSRSTTNSPRNVYRTADERWMCLSASTQATASRLFVAIGRADMNADPRFLSNALRLKNVQEVDRIVGGFIGARTLAENLEFFDREQITVGPVYDASQLAADPYVIERESLVELEDPEHGPLPMHNVVPRMSDTPGRMRMPAPAVGEHTRDVLQPLLGEALYRRLVSEGVIVERGDPPNSNGTEPPRGDMT
jgi:crotonobetainyl-CoA:carnitine CoA-transferase CaiB-like acyl-CoA transferase